MSNNGPFGFDPEDLARFARDASDGLRDALDQVGKFVGQPETRTKTPPQPATAGETGDGVWAIYTVDEDGSARIAEVFATELHALRAHKDNVDTARRVRFLPYGVTVGVLDEAVEEK